MWSSAYVDENTTIDMIVNAMTLIEIVLDILQQGCSEGTPSFETLDQVIRINSKDIDVIIMKFQTQKLKKSKAKP